MKISAFSASYMGFW